MIAAENFCEQVVVRAVQHMKEIHTAKTKSIWRPWIQWMCERVLEVKGESL